MQSLETDDSDDNMIRLTGLLRRLCEYSLLLPLLAKLEAVFARH